jgi:hypothetical protein
MSYNLTLECGCVVYVSCHPQTGVAHTRVIEQRGQSCRERLHDRGARLWLWELLPPSRTCELLTPEEQRQTTDFDGPFM